MILRVFGATDIGLVRQRNEDSLLVDEANAVFAVADGIGGMPGGDVASRSAVQAVRRELAADAAKALTDLGELVQWANVAVRRASRQFGHDGIGTTMTLAHVAGGRARIAHVGDSFALLIRGGQCRALTREHNVENERDDLFALAPYPPAYRYALTRSLGQPDALKVDVTDADLAQGDMLILTTDGLTDLVEQPEIASICTQNPEPEAAVATLIARACERGGHDNITVIALRVDEA